jgi:hypothetical protein
MKNMICICSRTKGVIAFAPAGEMDKAKSFRRNCPILKYARITEVLQAYPDKIQMYYIYDGKTGQMVDKTGRVIEWGGRDGIHN